MGLIFVVDVIVLEARSYDACSWLFDGIIDHIDILAVSKAVLVCWLYIHSSCLKLADAIRF